MSALESTVDMFDLRMTEGVRPLYEQVKAFIDSCDVVYVPEYSAGAQLRGLIQREATGPSPKLHSLLRYDGRNITPGWIVNRVEEAKVAT